MAETNARVMQMVRKELEKNRDVLTSDLFEKARSIDSSIGKLSARQFHAKYPLQVKRAMKGGGKRRGRKRAVKRAAKRATKRVTRAAKKTARRAAKTSAGPPAARKTTRKRAGRKATRTPRAAAETSGGRDAVRDLLLGFAKKVASADGKVDMVDVMTGLEGWVDRVMAARG
jgi:hypothetical protein